MASKTSRRSSGKMQSSLERLSISKPSGRSSQKPTPDSWEEDVKENQELSTPPASRSPSAPSTPVNEAMPGPPPPTPMSPTHRRDRSLDWSSHPQTRGVMAPSQSRFGRDLGGSHISMSTSATTGDRRPEKSNATAGRLIAGALGVKGPKMTDEQRQYERAVRDKERRRLDNEKEGARRKQREAEEARRAVWDD